MIPMRSPASTPEAIMPLATSLTSSTNWPTVTGTHPVPREVFRSHWTFDGLACHFFRSRPAMDIAGS